MASPGAELDLTFGVTFVGLVVTGCLFGVTTAQTGWYFTHYPQDRRLLKTLVTAVWLLDATHLGLYIATLFTYLVQKKALDFAVEALPWTSNVQLLCNAFAIGLIQSFYASRIWTLSRHKPLLAIMGLFVLVTWAFAIVLFIKTVTTQTVAEYIALAPLDIAMSVMAASTDVLLCGAMVFLLSTSRTGTQGADRLINKLMLYTVNTGLLTSFFAILSIITVATLPTTSLFIAFYYIGSQMYTVSLLATLNARLDLRMQAAQMGECTLPEIEITAAQRAPKLSLQTSPVVKNKRKRARLAVDPCLGFYQEIKSPAPQTTGVSPLSISTAVHEASNSDNAHIATRDTPETVSEKIPRLQTAPVERSNARGITPTRDNVESALTVEEFLRRAATSTKRYSARRGRRAKRKQNAVLLPRSDDTVVDPDSDYQPSEGDDDSGSQSADNRRGRRIVWTSDEEEYVPEKPAKKRRRKKKNTQSLSARILAAAVVTGVDVVGGPLFPASSALGTRRPLPLVPDNRAPSPATHAKPKCKIEDRHFVDPRKTKPFDHAVFQFAKPAGDSSDEAPIARRVKKEPRPITAWKPLSCSGDVGALSAGMRSKVPPCSRVDNPERRVMVPLKLVPAAQEPGQRVEEKRSPRQIPESSSDSGAEIPPQARFEGFAPRSVLEVVS
ncbi:hypothetical protein C8Q80DRAFT_1269277 [Daedaleopsis nitida]|nr:hypothetical protein C8Q80DRAFT_1269277 [Daedaleopsis nitida]